jgi:hypothetical protein
VGFLEVSYGCRLGLEGIVSELLCCVEQPELAATPDAATQTVGALKLEQYPVA